MLDTFGFFCTLQNPDMMKGMETQSCTVPYYPFACMQVRGPVWLFQIN